MADPVKQARELARLFAKAKRQAKGIKAPAGGASPKATADEIARQVTPDLLARGLIK